MLKGSYKKNMRKAGNKIEYLDKKQESGKDTRGYNTDKERLCQKQKYLDTKHQSGKDTKE